MMSDGRILVNEHRHLFAKCRVAWAALMLNCIAIHADLKAFFQSTGPALVAVGLVNLTQSIGL